MRDKTLEDERGGKDDKDDRGDGDDGDYGDDEDGTMAGSKRGRNQTTREGSRDVRFGGYTTRKERLHRRLFPQACSCEELK